VSPAPAVWPAPAAGRAWPARRAASAARQERPLVPVANPRAEAVRLRRRVDSLAAARAAPWTLGAAASAEPLAASVQAAPLSSAIRCARQGKPFSAPAPTPRPVRRSAHPTGGTSKLASARARWRARARAALVTSTRATLPVRAVGGSPSRSRWPALPSSAGGAAGAVLGTTTRLDADAGGDGARQIAPLRPGQVLLAHR
jgi:hypothetical protein